MYRPVLGLWCRPQLWWGPEVGSTGRMGGRASISRSSRVRVAEEGPTSRPRAWRPRTSVNQIVKMGRKRWFPSHIPALGKGEA